MSPERHEQVKKLFMAACALDEEERSAFLDRACAEDPALRDEVESLLKYHHPETLIRVTSDGAESDETDRRVAGQTTRTTSSPTDSDVSFPESPSRFPAGSVVADRYRIVGLLGRGGMGEVYRADDLKLHRAVALKFLTQGHADDPTWLSRFYNEARIALSVTHRNVCRVYDIGETEGEAFLSMEYVDGEDLASLLRRIGRLPQDKSIQITRQICYALAAAHSQGVLHRDLKPANVMIDGRGQVRVTDFGIAVLAESPEARAGVAGTPAYLAPETLVSGKIGVHSDLYALGAVMYEMITGRQAFAEIGRAEGMEGPGLAPPSTFVQELDPAFEQLIMRCLSADPATRPKSATEIATELPGGDPLLSVLEAGETPPPELVAAAGKNVRTRPIAAILWAGAAVIGLAAVLLLADHTFLISRLGLAKSPDVLEERSQQVIQALGGSSVGRIKDSGFVLNSSGLEPLRTGAREWISATPAAAAQLPILFFEYRERIQYDQPVSWLEETDPLGTGPSVTAENLVRLDPAGRLLEYRAICEGTAPQRPASAEPDWRPLFAMADLDPNRFKSVTPEKRLPIFVENRRAWEGSHSAEPNVLLRAEGAYGNGLVEYFDVAASPASGVGPVGYDPGGLGRPLVARKALIAFFFVTFFGGLPLAWHNLRLGRGDKRGARRLAAFVLFVEFLLWVVRHHPVPSFVPEANSLVEALRLSVFTAVAVWTYYIALEPYLRKLWPHSIVSWTRLLNGQPRDPLVGRDLLVGIALGTAIVLLQQINVLVSSWTGLSPFCPIVPPRDYELGRLLGLLHTLDTLCHSLLTSVGRAMILVMLMLLLRVVLRIPWLAGLALFLIVATAFLLGAESRLAFSWVVSILISAAALAALLYVGLLAVAAGIFVMQMILCNPMTADFHFWYSGATGSTLVILLGLILFALYAATARRPSSVDRSG